MRIAVGLLGCLLLAQTGGGPEAIVVAQGNRLVRVERPAAGHSGSLPVRQISDEEIRQPARSGPSLPDWDARQVRAPAAQDRQARLADNELAPGQQHHRTGPRLVRAAPPGQVDAVIQQR